MISHPVIKIGRIAIRKYPFARLEDIQRDAKLSLDRDLRYAPTPISGGMRSALHKELGSQSRLRHRSSALRSRQQRDLRECYGLFLGSCRHCKHVMFFDEVEDDVIPNCDRCKRPMWQVS